MKNKISIVILISFLILILVGCGGISTIQSKSTGQNKTTTSRFRIISSENISDGSTNGVNISILVDKETRVMYMQTEKYSAGYGLALQIMVDKDGKPLVFDGNLN